MGMYQIEDRSIVFHGGTRYTFDDFIAEAMPFDDAIVVRLENQGWKRTNENVLALDYGGRILWRIAPRQHAFGDSHYVNIYRKNEMVDVYNWDGTILTLHPKTGELISEGMAHGASHRSASPRQWM